VVIIVGKRILGLDEQQSADLTSLLNHLDDARKRGWHIPCQETDDPRPWTSDNAAQCAQAVRACYLCDAVEECRAYGVKYPAEHGIIGGLDTKERSKLHRKEKENKHG
jgi:hypothetical protein